jgi:hypothetical protein
MKTAAVIFTLLGAVAAAAPDSKTKARPLPPLSMSCPMHPEVGDDKGGKCPICGMAMQPVRLDLVWSCPNHPDVTAFAPGRCKIDGRELVKVIKAVSWTCRDHPQVNEVNPGVRPIDKRSLVVKYSLRPHGDHNPKHSGMFFMAPNNWHIEGTHPAPAVFRVYVYDNYSKPFVPNGLAARIVLPGDVSVPLKRLGKQPYLEARVPKLGVPAAVAVKIRFLPTEQEYRFDLPFAAYSKEPS